jgi:membrane protein required for colicin V production
MVISDFFNTAKWVWADYTIAGLVSVSTILGLFRGFVREAFALVTWLIAAWIAADYSQDLSAFLQSKISHPAARLSLAFVGLFFATLILGSLIALILNHLVKKSGLTGSDRLMGSLFGFLRGAILISLLILLAGLSPLPDHQWWKQSQLIPPFQSAAIWLKELMPSSLAENIKYR